MRIPPSPFEITRYNFSVPELSPTKLVFVSDLHDFSSWMVFDFIFDIGADAVLVPGDFIHSSSIYESGIEFLNMVSDFAPTFCTLGNHETRFNGDIKALVKEAGAILLDNESYMFNGINIGGLTSGYKFGQVQKRLGKTPAPDLEWLEKYSREDGYKILLSHHPEYYEKYIKDLPIDLILSGHAHGGQIRLFGRGIIAPGQGFFPKYTSGMYDDRLIVSRGIGNKFIVPRINNKREIIVISINGKR